MTKGILTLLLFILTGQFIIAQDINPPTIVSAQIVEDTITAGDSIHVMMVVTDDISGVNVYSAYTFFDAAYQPGHSSPSSLPSINNYRWTRQGGDTIIGALYVAPNLFFDSLFVQGYTIADYAGNTNHLYPSQLPANNPFADGVKVLPSTFIDTIAPVLDSIWLTQDTLSPLDTLKINIIASDNFGGNITAIFLLKRNGNIHTFVGPPTTVQINDTIQYQYVIDKYGDNGTFEVHTVRLEDTWGNIAHLRSPQYYQVPFELINRIEDHEYPVPISAFFVPDTLHRGDSASLYITVRDTISGIYEYTNAWQEITHFSTRIWNSYQQQSFLVNKPTTIVKDSLYKFDFKVSEFAADSVWKISVMTLVDSAGNYTDLSDPNTMQLLDTAIFVVVPDSITIIEGNVRTSTGAPLQNSRVYTVKFSPSDSLLISNRATYTDLNGNYQFFSEARDSNLYVKAIPNDTLYPNEIPTYWDSTWLIRDANVLIVNSNQITVDTFATLPGTNLGGHGFVYGYIWRGAGKQSPGDPVANLPLVLVDDQGAPIAFATTETTGAYSFSNIPDGTYSLYADWIGIDNALAPSITITQDSFELADLNFLVEYNKLVEVEEPINSIGILDVNEIAAYPNPTSGILYIRPTDGKLNGEVSVAVFSISGQMVHNTVTNSEQATVLDLTELDNGLYMILLTDGKHTISNRVQVQK